MKQTTTAVLLAKNEEQMLPFCLKTLDWVDHILVIDNGSTDDTAAIAADYGAQVIGFSHSSFARLRNEALKHVETDWLIYVDPDERITPTLAKEILVHLETDDADALSFNRTNICYGSEFHHGGWEEDQVTRAFKRTKLEKWEGKVHESPVYEGRHQLLSTPLLHLTHRNTTDGLKKTIHWTKTEAELLFKAEAPPVNFFTLVRKGCMEFIRRAIFKQGYNDGMPGLIEAIVQGINKFLVYIQLWELQQSPSLEDRYRQYEVEITKQWQEEDLSNLRK